MVQFQPATHLQVQEAECAGYGMDTFLLCVMFARLSELRSVLQGLIPELILNQHCFSINVWCDVIGKQLNGLYIFLQHLTGDIYANFLQDELPALLENVPLQT